MGNIIAVRCQFGGVSSPAELMLVSHEQELGLAIRIRFGILSALVRLRLIDTNSVYFFES